MYRLVEVHNGEYVYEITGYVKIGMLRRIHPTEAYLGIESGLVRVEYVGTINSDMENGNMQSYLDIAAVHHESLTEVMDGEYTTPIDEEIWVFYQYTNSGEIGALTLEEFVQHTMTY